MRGVKRAAASADPPAPSLTAYVFASNCFDSLLVCRDDCALASNLEKSLLPASSCADVYGRISILNVTSGLFRIALLFPSTVML